MATFPVGRSRLPSPGTTNEHVSDGVQVMPADVLVAVRSTSTSVPAARRVEPSGRRRSRVLLPLRCFARWLGSGQSIKPIRSASTRWPPGRAFTWHWHIMPPTRSRSVRSVTRFHTPSSRMGRTSEHRTRAQALAAEWWWANDRATNRGRSRCQITLAGGGKGSAVQQAPTRSQNDLLLIELERARARVRERIDTGNEIRGNLTHLLRWQIRALGQAWGGRGDCDRLPNQG